MFADGIKKMTALKCFSLIVLAVFMLSPNPVFAFFGGKIDNFTADQVEISPDGKVTNTIKIYYTPDAVRMDGIPGSGANPNMPAMNISMYTFKDKDQHYIFNHDKKLYYQTSLEEDGLAAAIKDYKDAQQVKELGNEKVSGYKCVKKEVTTTMKIYGMTQTSKITIWESDRFEMPLRTKSQDNHISEMRNIDKGGASGSDFKLPKGYKKVDNMMMAMGMDFGSMSQNRTDQDSQPVETSQNQDSTDEESSETQEQGSTMPQFNKKDIEKKIQDLGNKLKNFKFN